MSYNIDKVGDLGKVSMCRRILKHETSVNEEIPFYKISTFGGIADTFISKEKYELYKEKYSYPKVGDVLISAAGTIGKTVIFDGAPSFFQDSNIVWIDNNETKVLNSFLYYFYQTKPWIATSGSTILRLYNDNIRNLTIAYPDLQVQQKITKVLSNLDVKIELNNKINAELEAMAKLIYNYWFVQFDFPNEEGKPYKSSGGKMVWNEELKREIPEGWEVDTLSSWIEKDKSGDWGKEEIEGNYTERVFCIRGADLNGLNGKGEVKAPERFILEKNSHKMLDPHDLIVEISGGSPTQSTGRMAYISKETLERFDAPIVCSNFCKAVTLKNKKSMYNFAFEWYKAYDHGVLFGYEGKTSGIKNLLFESFVTSYFTPVAPRSLMEKFYNFMTPLESRKQKNLIENQKLAELRDWLLPMLMNGQVTVGKQVDPSILTLEKPAISPVVSKPLVPLTAQDAKVRRKMLATYIINQSLDDKSFGKTKFEKLLHLIEYHVLKFDYHQTYSVQAAGPYDGKFTIGFWNEVTKSKWFAFEEIGNLKRVIKGANHEKSLKDYGYLSEEDKRGIDALIGLFNGKSFREPEIISTLFAVWNNRIIRNEMVTDELLKNDFLAWDEGKRQYADRLDKALSWMREKSIVPDGWGKVIGLAKGKK